MRRNTRRAIRRGFTLIEIMVVVTIIAILASLIGWRVMSAIGKSEHSAAKAQASAIRNALQAYSIETTENVEDDFDLGVLLLDPDQGGGPGGPYMEKRTVDAITDPWGVVFQVRVPGEEFVEFDILSYGADKQPGGVGENEDIVG